MAGTRVASCPGPSCMQTPSANPRTGRRHPSPAAASQLLPMQLPTQPQTPTWLTGQGPPSDLPTIHLPPNLAKDAPAQQHHPHSLHSPSNQAIGHASHTLQTPPFMTRPPSALTEDDLLTTEPHTHNSYMLHTTDVDVRLSLSASSTQTYLSKWTF